MATCNSCGAEVIWKRTEGGKLMPLSVASKEKRFVIGFGGLGHADYAYPLTTFISHFADCPNADQHRKR